jgi:hypothetical protein
MRTPVLGMSGPGDQPAQDCAHACCGLTVTEITHRAGTRSRQNTPRLSCDFTTEPASLAVSLSRCLAVSLSRCLAVSLSRCLAVSLSRCLMIEPPRGAPILLRLRKNVETFRARNPGAWTVSSVNFATADPSQADRCIPWRLGPEKHSCKFVSIRG